MRLIDADALIEKWYEVNNIGPEDCGARFIGYTEIPRFINNAPTVQEGVSEEAISEPKVIPIKLEKRYPESKDEDITDAFLQGYIKGKVDRPQGEWIEKYNGNGWDDFWDYTCSHCGKKYERADAVLYHANFCPNCGARMKGGAE